MVVLVLLGLALSESQAQADLSKVLVGRWDGEIDSPWEKRLGPYRTLIIKSVRQDGGTWTVNVLYGVTGKGTGPVSATMEVISGEVILKFLTQANSAVTLTLYKEKSLQGSFRGAGGSRDYPIKFTKID
jgi:hypothetical protein